MLVLEETTYEGNGIWDTSSNAVQFYYESNPLRNRMHSVKFENCVRDFVYEEPKEIDMCHTNGSQ